MATSFNEGYENISFHIPLELERDEIFPCPDDTVCKLKESFFRL